MQGFLKLKEELAHSKDRTVSLWTEYRTVCGNSKLQKGGDM